MGEWQKRKINSEDSLQIPVSEAPVMRESVSAPVTTEISDEMHKTETETPLTEESMEDEPAELTEEFASAPEHMDAHLITEFDNTLDDLKNKAQARKTNSLDRLPETPQASMLKNVYTKFMEYADIRQTVSTYTEIKEKVETAGAVIQNCIDKKAALVEEHASLVGSLVRLSAAEVREAKEIRNRIVGIETYMTLLDEMESFLNFIKNDNYSGSLDTTGAVIYEDGVIGMNAKTGPDYTISYDHIDTSQPLFHRPPQIEDVHQGSLGDCYLLAGLASIVATDPALITKSMKDLGDYVCVQFYKKPYGPTDIIKVTVKKSVPKGVKKYNDSNEKDEIISEPFAKESLWVKMIEKAYTASGLRTKAGKDTDSIYQNISGGFSHVFVQQMTGRKGKSHNMAANKLLDKGNSLIGAYSEMMQAKDKDALKKIDASISKLYGRRTFIDRTKLKKAVKVIFDQFKSIGICIEDAVKIAVKMEDEEKKTHLKTGGKTIPGRAMVLTDLYRILQNTRLTVPKGHIIGEAFIAEAAVDLGIKKQVIGKSFNGKKLDTKIVSGTSQQKKMARDVKGKYEEEGRFISKDDSLIMAKECERRLDRLAESRGITFLEMDDDFVGNLFDQRTKSGTREQEALADRIRQTYADRNMFIGEDDALTLAIAYEEAYKHALAEAMIRKLKASEDMALAYSPFYSRMGKHGKKQRYTHKAKEIYEEIENAINRGAIVTAGTVSFHRQGDSSKKDGVVEGHAYSVLGTLESNGTRYIRLRNPWGHYTREYNGTKPEAANIKHGTGTFVMELNDFISNFRKYRINK